MSERSSHTKRDIFSTIFQCGERHRIRACSEPRKLSSQGARMAAFRLRNQGLDGGRSNPLQYQTPVVTFARDYASIAVMPNADPHEL